MKIIWIKPRENDPKKMDDKEQVLMQRKWSNNLLFLVICSSLHTLVNKYVLSALKFQYPTLFISWQCGVCVFSLMVAHVFGYIKLSLIDRTLLKSWLPYMILHTAFMYFGSVSLSKLAIPMFVGLQNLTYVCIELLTIWRSKVVPAVLTHLSLVIIVFGAVHIFHSNWKTNPVAYKWVSAYILCLVSLALYTISFEVMKVTKLRLDE